MFRFLLIVLFLWSCAMSVFARETLPLDTGRTEISLISDYDTVAPGQDFTVVLRMRFDPDWYTYWRNPGDSGEPVMIRWDLPEGFTAGDIQWPVPHIKWTGPIASYALDEEVLLPVTISIADTVDPSVPVTLDAHALFLVCADVCVPEDGKLSLVMGLGEAEIDPEGSDIIQVAQAAIPKIVSAKGGVVSQGEALTFDLIELPAGFEPLEIYPNVRPVLAHSEPVTRTLGEDGFRFSGTSGYGWEDGAPESFAATLVDADGEGVVVNFAVGESFNIGPVTQPSAQASIGFFAAVIGAFIGGLILNLMPCVFPIISLKALSLAKTAHGERSATRRAGWAYTTGVLVSFAVFALVLIGLKAAGTSVGWGFQLQSPWLVGLLALLLFAIGLNLLGVYEIGGRLQNIGNDTVSKSGPFSSFLTGVLAVIVATPCTAPFMAGAVGYALASSAFITLAVFLALGLGFALPFLLVAYMPGLLARLPKPGTWMDTFKQFLAFPMFAAAIWLVWVLSLQAGAGGVLKLLLGGLALTFGIWLLRRKGNVAKLIGILALGLSIYLPVSVRAVDGEAVLSSQAWSADRVANLQAEGRPVFVDFTAAWCVTCKVNEGLVLNTRKTKALLERTDTAFLVADWTNKDDVIAAELKRFGRAGVPLYLVYTPDSADPEILPQILTYDILKEALE